MRRMMTWFPWALSGFLAILLAGGFYLFGLRGNVRTGDDGRTSVILTSGERNLVLGEMRGFLESVQEIVEAVSENDMKAAARAALRSGRVNLDELPPSLVGKLPLEVKRLGLDTHRKFHALGKDIEGGLARDKVLPRLAEMMNNCVGCHAGYRLDIEKGN